MNATKLFPRIVVETVPNQQCRPYNINMAISESRINSFDFPLRDTSDKYLGELGPIGQGIVRKLNQVPGIVSVSISLYCAQIIIGKAFMWEDDGIDEAVIEALKDAFGDRRDEVEIERKDVRGNYRD